MLRMLTGTLVGSREERRHSRCVAEAGGRNTGEVRGSRCGVEV